MNQNLPVRKKPASGVFRIDGQPTVVFDTVCTKDRKRWLADKKVHHALIKSWTNADAWLVGRYIVMPDHVHYFAWETGSGIAFERWETFWKSQFSHAHGQRELRLQSKHWDRRMRCESAYEEKWAYVFENPVRGGLVDEAEEWPYQGMVHDLRW